jgi:hypothetical protein
MYLAHKPCLRLIRGEPQSGSDLQPKVAAQRLPWGRVTANLQPQQGCVGIGDKTDATPLEL